MIYNDKYLTFPDKATQETFYKPDEENPVNLFPQLFWDIIGTIYEPGTYDEEGNELTPPTPLDGWHVNVSYHFLKDWPTELDPYIIEPPATPYRVRTVPELTPDRRKRLDCTRLQAEIMLEMMGIKDTVEAWVGQQDAVVQAAYHKAYRFSRNSDLWELAKAEFGWNGWDLDKMFKRAREFKV